MSLEDFDDAVFRAGDVITIDNIVGLGDVKIGASQDELRHWRVTDRPIGYGRILLQPLHADNTVDEHADKIGDYWIAAFGAGFECRLKH